MKNITKKDDVHPPGQGIEYANEKANARQFERKLEVRPNSKAKAPRVDVEGLLKRIEDLELLVDELTRGNNK